VTIDRALASAADRQNRYVVEALCCHGQVTIAGRSIAQLTPTVATPADRSSTVTKCTRM
jgi:hypothetical protein